jgi:hypothetical protein
MAASNSRTSSDSQSTSTQVQQTGSSQGSNSPVLSATGNINVTDAGSTQAALAGMEAVVLAALKQGGDIGGQLLSNSADQSAANASNNAALLQTVLKSNSDLAANVQSGGAASAQKTTNYVIFGLIGLGAIMLAAWFFKKA